MKIKHIHAENFCGLKEFDSDIYDRTLISGKNETGKSTVRNVVFYTLTGKLADGSAADSIRPLDKDGKTIDNIDVVGELTIEHNNENIVLKRTQHQKWVSHRGSSDKTYEGDETLYEINGIPKRLKDYQAYIDNIVDPETLLYGTNAQALLSLDTKKRRAKLMSLVGDSSLEDIAKSDPKYADIVPMLKDGTIDELLARSRKIIKAKNEELESIPVRIDEASKMIVDRDFSELELLKNSLIESKENIEQEIKTGTNQAEIEELKQKKFELQFNINDCKRKAHDELLSKRHDLNSKSAQLEIETDGMKNTIRELERQADLWKQTITDNENIINDLKPRYEDAKNSSFDDSKWVFDDSSTVCSLCGQKLPADKITDLKNEFKGKKEEAKKAFEDSRNKTLEEIKTKGNNLAIENKTLKEKLEKNQDAVSEKKNSLKAVESQIADLKSQLALLPTEPDMSDNTWYNELLGKDRKYDQEILSLENKAVDTKALEEKKANIEEQLSEINNQLAAAENNAKIDERIEALTQQQRSVAQMIANEEKILDLLISLNYEYVDVLTDKVNSFFKYVKWRMFKYNKTNNGFTEVCEPTVDGISYYKNLNHGNKLLAELDIEKTFQDIGGIELFLTCDDCESIDADRIPSYENRQIILFRREDVSILTVKQL